MANKKKETNTPVVDTPVTEAVTNTPVADTTTESTPTVEKVEVKPVGEEFTVTEKEAPELKAMASNLETMINEPPIENPNKEEVEKAIEELESDLGEDIPSVYDITNYVVESARTLAPAKPVEDGLKLITNDPNVVVNGSKIAMLLIEIMEVANKADIHKRAVFYGDPKVQSRLSKQQGVIESLRERLQHGDLDFNDEATLDLLHAIWGIQSELGEIAEELINSKAEKRQVNITNLKEETGDIMWYSAILMRACKTFFQNVAELNINKLKARYPDKFEDSKALNRDLEAEKDVLNS